jgi:tetratricopeptide (TPR) repeat protein
LLNLKSKDWILVAGIIAGLFAVYLLSGPLEARHVNLTENLEEDELSLQGEKLKGYAFGFEGLLADWYWVRSLQYIGEKVYKSEVPIDIDNLKPLNPKLLYPLLDNATTLDPQFLAVYSYGATVMPAIDKQQAIAIAKKGIRNNPEQWRLYHQLGFIYWKIKDFKNASKTYQEGAEIEGAPDWMTSMSALVNKEGGSRDTARKIYRQLFENATDSRTKESASIRLLELDSLEEREILDVSLIEFKERNKRCASNWKELTSILLTKKLGGNKDFRIDADGNIVDPTDAPYLIDQTACKTKLFGGKTKLPLN